METSTQAFASIASLPLHITSIEGIFQSGIIPDGIIEKARFVRNRRTSLFASVKNMQALSTVLATLGYGGYQNDQDPRSTVELPSGTTIEASGVIAWLGWAPTSYRNKAKAVIWAEHVAQNMRWKDIIPGMPSHRSCLFQICCLI